MIECLIKTWVQVCATSGRGNHCWMNPWHFERVTLYTFYSFRESAQLPKSFILNLSHSIFNIHQAWVAKRVTKFSSHILYFSKLVISWNPVVKIGFRNKRVLIDFYFFYWLLFFLAYFTFLVNFRFHQILIKWSQLRTSCQNILHATDEAN